jgi:VWD domain-containing protein
MAVNSYAQKNVHSVLGVVALTVILLASACSSGGAGGVGGSGPTPTKTGERLWRAEIVQVPSPAKGCFKAVFPKLEWLAVSCTRAPAYPQPPGHGPRPATVGNTNDIGTKAPTGLISTATGSFDSVTGVTSESGPIGNSGPAVADAYTLQVNTDQFTTGACTGSPNPGCKGWEQFVFFNDGSTAAAYIEYWLIRYNKSCPAGAGWIQFQFTGSTDIYCYKNESNPANPNGAVPIPEQPITNLGRLSLSGTVGTSGDSVTLVTAGTGSIPSTAYRYTGDDAVKAAAGWTIAEFNVFGDGGNSGGGGEASFNSGSAIMTRTRITYGGAAAPICVAQAFTGETNNLSFGPTAPMPSQPGPAMLVDESYAGGATSACAAATTVGDTHLRTFNGLLYDFQASGDFLLAQAKDFTVQTRQVSGAPTWPNASVNTAVGTQMGSTRVALCAAPSRLVVNGRPAALADGQTLTLPSGVDILRAGNVYFVTGQTGDSVRAVMNSTWIDVSVGLGTWPTAVRGLLANVNGNVNELETSGGAVVEAPVSFGDLYGSYGNSWRVPPADSLLSDCGGKIEQGIPKQPFFANDLAPDIRDRTRAICTQAGVKESALLDACTLDVAVLGKQAASVYVGALAPAAVGNGK